MLWKIFVLTSTRSLQDARKKQCGDVNNYPMDDLQDSNPESGAVYHLGCAWSLFAGTRIENGLFDHLCQSGAILGSLNSGGSKPLVHLYCHVILLVTLSSWWKDVLWALDHIFHNPNIPDCIYCPGIAKTAARTVFALSAVSAFEACSLTVIIHIHGHKSSWGPHLKLGGIFCQSYFERRNLISHLIAKSVVWDSY